MSQQQKYREKVDRRTFILGVGAAVGGLMPRSECVAFNTM